MAPTNETAEGRLAENMRTRREQLGMSQDALARLMQVEGFGQWRQSTVYNVERGARRVQLDEAMSLASILAVDLATLIGETFGLNVALRDVRRAEGGIISALDTYVAAVDNLRVEIDAAGGLAQLPDSYRSAVEWALFARPRDLQDETNKEFFKISTERPSGGVDSEEA